MGLRVLHLIDSGGLYGAERMLLTLVEEQIRQGLEPTILSAGEPGIEEKPIEGEARRLDLPVIPWRMKAGLNLREASNITHWAKDRGIHVLHSHGYKFNILIGLLPTRRRRGIPLVCTLHGYVKASRWTKMALYEWLDRSMLKRADRVVIVDDGMRDLLPKSVARSLSCVFVPNGISSRADSEATVPLSPAMQEFMDGHDFNLLAVGRLSPEKGLDVLIDALTDSSLASRSVGLVIVGEGKLKGALQRQATEQGVAPHVLFAGYHANAASLMPSFDALVMPSRTEGLPITVLEALRARLPIVATRVGGLPATLAALPAAQLVDPDDKHALAEALRALVDHGTSQDALDASACSFARRFTSQLMAEKYTDVYQGVVAAGTAVGPKPHSPARTSETNG